MRRFKDFVKEGPPKEKILTMVTKDKEAQKKRDPEDLDEVTLHPKTARILSLAVLARILNHRKKVENATDIGEKLNAMASLLVDNSYLGLIAIALDQKDTTLLRKVTKK